MIKEVARQAEGSQPTQPNPNPIHRTGRPIVTEQTSRSSAQEIDTRSSLDCERIPICLLNVQRKTKSRVILIEKSFKPIYNKVMPTTHLVEKSKKMIRDMGNVELFELCETILKVQCTECLLYWNQGIVYCTLETE